MFAGLGIIVLLAQPVLFLVLQERTWTARKLLSVTRVHPGTIVSIEFIQNLVLQVRPPPPPPWKWVRNKDMSHKYKKLRFLHPPGMD